MFPCTKCGKCCKHLNLSSIYEDLDRGDGVCKYLRRNLCSIYEHRPLKCRIDDAYHAFFESELSLDEYYRLNIEMCKKLRNMEE